MTRQLKNKNRKATYLQRHCFLEARVRLGGKLKEAAIEASTNATNAAKQASIDAAKLAKDAAPQAAH
jgi:hypothetical protein